MEENRQISAAEAKRLYQREWRRKNPEKVRAIQQRYWERKALEYLGGEADVRKADASD